MVNPEPTSEAMTRFLLMYPEIDPEAGLGSVHRMKTGGKNDKKPER
jgi:hypothetical protein